MNVQPNSEANEHLVEPSSEEGGVHSANTAEPTVSSTPEVPKNTDSREEVHELHQFRDRLVQNTFLTELWPVLISRPEIALVLYRKLQSHYETTDLHY